jgi:hypothetical protein
MADFRTIMSLVFKGHSYRQIVEVVGCSHRDVSTVRKMIADRGITAQRLAGMSDAELVGLFPDGRSGVSTGYDGPDFARVVASMRSIRISRCFRPGVAMSDRSRTCVSTGIRYCHLFGQYAARNDLVATLHHEPGRAMFVDWAGDTIGLVDAAGGTPAVAYLFVAVLPFSGCVYCRAFTDMRTEAWIAAHIGAFEMFGGVPQIVVSDHASTATHRTKQGDAARFVNDRYRQMADHYGTAIVPARVRKPRDKAAVESAVNTVNKRVIGYLLEETWTSLADLNEAIAERVHEINHELRRADGAPGSSGSPPRRPRYSRGCLTRRSSRWTGERSRSGATTTSRPTTSTTQCLTRWPGACFGCG